MRACWQGGEASWALLLTLIRQRVVYCLAQYRALPVGQSLAEEVSLLALLGQAQAASGQPPAASGRPGPVQAGLGQAQAASGQLQAALGRPGPARAGLGQPRAGVGQPRAGLGGQEAARAGVGQAQLPAASWQQHLRLVMELLLQAAGKGSTHLPDMSSNLEAKVQQAAAAQHLCRNRCCRLAANVRSSAADKPMQTLMHLGCQGRAGTCRRCPQISTACPKRS